MISNLLRLRPPRAWPIFLCSILLAAQASAQSTRSSARPDPLDPKASVPALRYESAITSARRPKDEPPLSWREANDTVARIGGWRVYAREAQQADAPAATAPAAKPPGTKPADTTHQHMPAGHGMHKHP